MWKHNPREKKEAWPLPKKIEDYFDIDLFFPYFHYTIYNLRKFLAIDGSLIVTLDIYAMATNIKD